MLHKSPKILILRLSSIGDILLATPFIRQTRKAFPEAHISFIIKREFADLIRFNPHIDEIHEFDSSDNFKNLRKLNTLIKNENFDLIFDLHNNLRTHRILKSIKKASIFKINKSKIKRAILVYLKVSLYKSIKPVAERYLDVGGKSGITDDGLGLELFRNNQIEERADEIIRLRKISPKYICIAPAAAHFTKMWPLDYSIKFTEALLEKTDYNVVVLGGPAEKSMLNCFPQTERVINLTGDLTLLESAAILARSAGLVSNDSGLMHMASAVNVPIVALFGSTVEELGFFPYRSQSTIIENNTLWCRPCSHFGRSSCPLGHFKCMREITVDQVLNLVSQKLIKI